MKLIRRWHLYLSCFFAPMLIFYISTGWYQTFNPNRNKAFGEKGSFVTRLRSIHVDQIYPTYKATDFSPILFKYLVVLMSICLLLTIVLGLFLAFKSLRTKWTLWLSLSLGVIVPVIALWLGAK